MANFLIVDDSTAMRNRIKELLENMGHVVIGEAINGEQGIRKYKEVKPQIVTMDISMPVMTGIEALKKILEFDKDAKILMVSAMGQKSIVIEAIMTGAKGYIIKPIEQDKFGLAIERTLNGK